MYGVQLFKTKTLFIVIDIRNNFIQNYHFINFGTLSTPRKDIAGWGRFIFFVHGQLIIRVYTEKSTNKNSS